MRTSWNPSTYLEFAAYRARPAEELIAQIDITVPGAIFDLGCGPGTLTRKLKDRWPARPVTGLDSSKEMLTEARKKFPAGDIAWEHADISAWAPPSPPAMIFANAALHWVPDHKNLFPRLMACVAPGGIFAMQMPMTDGALYHVCTQRVLEKPRWRDRLAGVHSHEHPKAADFYYDAVCPTAARIDIWEGHYHHVMRDSQGVTAWASGTTLVPYLTVLTDDEKQAFLEDYTAVVTDAYPPQSDGKVLFTMRRVFMVAVRAGAET
jgi:trans-aconitate 2-methyltransferase